MKKTKAAHTTLAKQWWKEYKVHRSEYTKYWKDFFGEEMPKIRKGWWGMIKRGSRNLTRIPEDFLRMRRTNFKNQETENSVVELSVEDRRIVIKDAVRGMVGDKNAKTYRSLAIEAVATEVNCRNIIRIKGLKLGQFYKILWRLGVNIRPFFSEDKGENAGRWVMDNYDLPNIYPGIVDESRDEYYLQKMFPKAPSWTFWGKWTNSRTHGVVFEINTNAEQPDLLIPVHIDAENAFVAIRELITGKKRREISAVEYHRMPEQQGSMYVGSGLSEIGCLVLIGLMRKAKEKGIIKDVKVKGKEKLVTTGSISGDDELMWKVTELIRLMGDNEV